MRPFDLPDKIYRETQAKLKKAFCELLSRGEVAKKLEAVIQENAENDQEG